MAGHGFTVHYVNSEIFLAVYGSIISKYQSYFSAIMKLLLNFYEEDKKTRGRFFCLKIIFEKNLRGKLNDPLVRL